MPDLSWILYDTAVFDTVAGSTHELFQVSQGGDATHTEDFTNSPGAGVIPQTQSFVAKGIAIYPELDISQAELQKVFNKAWLEIIVADLVMFKCPLANLAAAQSYGGHYSQAAAANANMISYSGPVFEFEIPISIPGGTPFKVVLHQVIAMAAAEQIKLLLNGTLSRP